jgi:general secretion pathway protein A
MYKKFFGLTRSPFDISPDPYFLFPTPRHNEALASIVHGVIRRKGFMVLSGEVGTGKTLMVRCLLELLRARGIASANVFNPRLRPKEFLHYIIGDLGLNPESPDNKGALLLQLYNYVIARQQKNQTTVLIVDEAQNMDVELLEEIRLLTNLETAQQKLIQIVLVGQPELDQKLDSPQLRQLKQRITLRCTLGPFEEIETRAYIWQRMKRAGMTFEAVLVFPPATVAAIYHYSQGIPRLINTICENALIHAYAQQSKQVTEQMVDEVATDLRLRVTSLSLASGNGSTVGQESIAQSLLNLVNMLDRAACGPFSRSPESDSVSTELVKPKIV